MVFTILSTVSLMLFVAVVVLWVRSYFVVDEMEYGYFDHQPYTGVECAVCGYDVSAMPERCPECGAVAAEEPGGAARAGGGA